MMFLLFFGRMPDFSHLLYILCGGKIKCYGKIGADFDGFFAYGVGKAQRRGAELLRKQPVRGRKRPLRRRAVLRVAQNGAAEVGAVQAELVRPPGQGVQLQKRGVRRTLQHAVARAGGLAV